MILAGIGRFGNFVARMLRSQKIGVTVIDHDSDHIDDLRKLGIQAFYGDANRHDLLESAGAAKAKIIIIALDEEERTAQLIATVRKHFPHLRILVRALTRPHQTGSTRCRGNRRSPSGRKSLRLKNPQQPSRNGRSLRRRPHPTRPFRRRNLGHHRPPL